LANSFVGDARFLIEHNGLMADPDGWRAALARDYFHSSSGNFIPYWRPWTRLSWWLEYQLWGTSPIGYHAVQVFWHVTSAGLAMGVARALGAGQLAAGVTGLTFGLHPAAAEPVNLVMARSDVVCVAASLAALLGWLRWSRGEGRGWLWFSLAGWCLALGSKESSVAILPALGVNAAATAWWRTRGWRAHVGALAPFAALAALAALGRALVLGPDSASSITIDPLRIGVGLAESIRAAVPGPLETNLRSLGRAEAASLPVLMRSLVTLAVAGGAFALALRRRHAGALTVLVWGVAALAPVLMVGEVHVPGAAGKIALADRWVLPAAAAAAIWIPWALARPVSPRAFGLSAAMIAAWALLVVALSPAVHERYANELALLGVEDRDYLATPAEHRTRQDDCRARERAVVRAVGRRAWEEVLARTGTHDAGCASDLDQGFNRLVALDAIGDFPAAATLSEALVRSPQLDQRHRLPLLHLRGRALVQTGRVEAGLAALRAARTAGLQACGLLVDEAEALAKLGRRRDAEAAVAAARACVQRPN
jgi:Fe2+ transport system protein FeoA